jgi:hypothetical protein
MRPDRKKLLDELGFAWKDDGANNFKSDDKLWHARAPAFLSSTSTTDVSVLVIG